MICAEGGSAGKKCGITEQDICFGNKLFANEPLGGIPSKFILYLYLSPIFRRLFSESMTGIIGGVSIAKFLELPIPIPH
ncbi:restriction endonuclease subunit S [Acinetobacter seifertii]|nr:restriction endonuclease subunit S [Acinetobacter seifertii]